MSADRRRILLAEIKPRIPQAPLFTTWNPSDKDSSITLSNGNLTATKSVTHATAWGCVRAILAMRIMPFYCETTYNFTGTGNVAVGLAKSSMPLNVRPGSVAFAPDGSLPSLAGPDRNGDCYVGGGSAVNIGAITSGTIVRHWLDLDSWAYRVARAADDWVTVLDGDVLYQAIASQALYLIGGLLRPSGSTASIIANLGASPFTYEVPPGVNAGIASYPAPIETTVYLSDGMFNTGSGDTPANTIYDARIPGDADVVIERRASCWVWGEQTTSRRGQLAVVNRDGALDDWYSWEWRDAEYVLYSGFEGDARAAFTRWSTGVVDRIESAPGRRISIVFADGLAQLDRPIQTDLYPEGQANAQLAGKPKPIALGRPMYCEAALLDTSTLARNYQLHDGWSGGNVLPYLNSIDAIYDKGDVFDPPPTDWTYYTDDTHRIGFHLVNAPVGKIVANPIGAMRSGNVVIEYLPEIFEYIFSRAWNAYGTAAVWDVDWTNVHGLDDKAHYRMAEYLREAKTFLALLRDVMDCFCGWVIPTRAGQITVGRVEEPSSTAVLVLDKTNVKSVSISIDQAKGLTQRLAGRKNHSPHSSDSDLSSTISLALKQELKALYTIVKRGASILQPGDNSPVAGTYAHAIGAEAKGTLLQEALHIQAEANRVATTWRKLRAFYDVDAVLGPAAIDALELGQTVQLVWPWIKGLENGKNLLTVGITDHFRSRNCPLVGWAGVPQQ